MFHIFGTSEAIRFFTQIKIKELYKEYETQEFKITKKADIEEYKSHIASVGLFSTKNLHIIQTKTVLINDILSYINENNIHIFISESRYSGKEKIESFAAYNKPDVIQFILQRFLNIKFQYTDFQKIYALHGEDLLYIFCVIENKYDTRNANINDWLLWLEEFITTDTNIPFLTNNADYMLYAQARLHLFAAEEEFHKTIFTYKNKHRNLIIKGENIQQDIKMLKILQKAEHFNRGGHSLF
jgi:hypothetical protein